MRALYAEAEARSLMPTVRDVVLVLKTPLCRRGGKAAAAAAGVAGSEDAGERG